MSSIVCHDIAQPQFLLSGEDYRYCDGDDADEYCGDAGEGCDFCPLYRFALQAVILDLGGYALLLLLGTLQLDKAGAFLIENVQQRLNAHPKCAVDSFDHKLSVFGR